MKFRKFGIRPAQNLNCEARYDEDAVRGWFQKYGVCSPITGEVLQSNQLIQIIRDLVFIDQGLLGAQEDPFYFNLIAGIVLATIAGSIIFGGLNRIARAATVIVPFMAVLYLGTILIALGSNIEKVPAAFALIIEDAFTGEAVAGGTFSIFEPKAIRIVPR